MTGSRADLLRYLSQLAEGEPVIILDAPPADQTGDATVASDAVSVGTEAPLPEVPEAPLPPAEPRTSDPAKVGELAELTKSAATCTLCELSKTRINVVFGTGDPQARLMLIGEAPGADEDRQGEPFVGRAGQLLNRILAAMKLQRSEVYIANILKCRPPGNRNPDRSEAAACLPYLHRQIELIDPAVIVAMGLVAAVHLMDLNPSVSVKSLRGRIHDLNRRPLVVTYHPAALLRNPSFKAPTWEDMQMVMKLLSGEINWQPESGSRQSTII